MDPLIDTNLSPYESIVFPAPTILFLSFFASLLSSLSFSFSFDKSKIRRAHSRTKISQPKSSTGEAVVLVVDRVLVEHVRFDVALELLGNNCHELDGPIFHEKLDKLQSLVSEPCGCASTFPFARTAAAV